MEKLQILTIVFVALVMSGSTEAGMDEIKSWVGKAENFANDILGTSDRQGEGCTVKWSFKGQMMGFQFKYFGVCVDTCTGITTTSITESRGGAIEHCLSDLFQQLSAKQEL